MMLRDALVLLLQQLTLALRWLLGQFFRPRPAPVPPQPGPTPVPPAPEPQPEPQPDPVEPIGWKLVTAHNEIRRDSGRSELRADDHLAAAARSHAAWMAKNHHMDHNADRQSGVHPSDRAQKAGYSSRWVGENIAMGQASVEAVMAAWMKSSGHKANILSRDYNDIGCGYAQDGNGRYWWCVTFGRAATPRTYGEVGPRTYGEMWPPCLVEDEA